MNDDTFEFNDPYANLYQTPQKKNETINNNHNKNHNPTQPKNKKENKNVFNPYEQQKNDEEEKPKINAQDDLPKYVDLTKNAYERKDQGGDDEDLPLLEELGICPENIKMKLVSVLTFHKIDKRILVDADMAGPLLVFILFGISLVLVKHFFIF